jgi:peptidyl-prolyl cis-trans isomerase SDCCAG10
VGQERCPTIILLTGQRDVKLLSFGGNEDGEEETEPIAFKKKNIARPDCESPSQ